MGHGVENHRSVDAAVREKIVGSGGQIADLVTVGGISDQAGGHAVARERAIDPHHEQVVFRAQK